MYSVAWEIILRKTGFETQALLNIVLGIIIVPAAGTERLQAAWCTIFLSFV
jgi:hypothetical protein